jgi:hypothetical protein
MKESEFNAKGELSFGHKFKLVARKNKIIWIYSTNKDLIHDFPEFQYTSESEKEAKAVYDESLLIRLIEYIK